MTSLITAQDLAGKTKTELSGLHRHFVDALIRSEAGTVERRNALASLENISRAMAARGPSLDPS